jgi:5'-methylthioadenosine phosphorylase
VIGGVGFSLDGVNDEVETIYGRVPVIHTRIKGQKVMFIPRHGTVHLPPHKVNYRAVISAAKESGIARVISINTVGSMRAQAHPPGAIFLPADFVEFTKCRPNTFFEDRAVHVDMSQPYCPELRSYLAEAARTSGLPAAEGVYVCAGGPHLESPAQIRMMSRFGDVVGMTGYPEVVLAREAQLCYASLCLITNLACGISGTKSVTVSEIPDMMKKCHEDIRKIIYQAAQRFAGERSCSCQKSLSNAAL